MSAEKTLGEKLRAAREEKGLSLRKLSIKSGISQDSISRWENDACDPSFFNICCVAEVLGLSLDYLAGKNDDPYVDLAEYLTGRNVL